VRLAGVLAVLASLAAALQAQQRNGETELGGKLAFETDLRARVHQYVHDARVDAAFDTFHLLGVDVVLLDQSEHRLNWPRGLPAGRKFLDADR